MSVCVRSALALVGSGIVAGAFACGAFACGSFGADTGSDSRVDAGSSTGADAGPRFCVPSESLLMCSDFDEPSPVGPLAYFLRSDAGTTEESAAHASSPPRSFHATTAAGGGRAQLAVSFPKAREEVSVALRVFVAAPPVARVRLVTLEGPANSLSLVIDGTVLVVETRVVGPAGDVSVATQSSPLGINAGGWSAVRLEVSQLDSKPNVHVGENDEGTRITPIPSIGAVRTVAVGAEVAAPGEASEVFVDDVVILEH